MPTNNLIFLTLFFFTLPCLGQNKEKTDSLKALLNEGEIESDSLKFRIYNDIAFYSSVPDSAFKYAEILIDRATQKESDRGLYMGHLQAGNVFRLKGDYDQAVAHFMKGIQAIERGQLGPSSLATIYVALADVYSIIGNHENSVNYYKRAIGLIHSSVSDLSDSIQLATTLINLGDEFYSVGAYDSALYYFSQEEKLIDNLPSTNPTVQTIKAYNQGNKGLVYAELGNKSLAEENISQAVDLLKELQDFYGISAYLNFMVDVYIDRKNYREALKYVMESLSIANDNGLKEQVRDASLKLSEIYEMSGQIPHAYKYHKQYVAYRDSINNEETIQKIADLRTEYEVGLKQAEVDLLNVEKRNQRLILFAVAGFAFILVILAFIIYKYYQSKARTNKILETQKQELEALNQTKDKFFSIISHDLRGPVSSFHGISRMIKFLVQTKDTDQLLEITDDIDQSVDRVSALLDNLLSWAMQQQGHFPNVPEKVDLKELADELVQTLKTMAKGKNISLTSQIDLSINLWVDRNTTMTILRNLVNNALKFTPEEGSVTISAYARDDFAEISVTDTGVGILAEKLRKLFRLQDKKSTYGTAGEKGLGLGLQLVYEFVEMNGGSIEVSSTEQEGTTFTVRLPLFVQRTPFGESVGSRQTV